MARVAVTPEEIRLDGCWQVIAVQRESIDLSVPNAAPTREIGYYVSSATVDEHDDLGMIEAIRGHWSGSENGTHYRRDVSLGEDACRTAHKSGAQTLAILRNLTIGLYELERASQRTQVDTLASWCQQQTFTKAYRLLRR